jgi:hypothetical protein
MGRWGVTATTVEIPKSDVPEGVSGDWRVERFTVSLEDAQWHNLRCAINRNSRGRNIEPGTYTRLMCGREVVMSDTPAEMRDHREFVERATGSVLIHGLGLGMCAVAALEKSDVRHVLIVEKSPDVLRLVGNHIRARYGNRVTIVGADALEWQAPKGHRWDVVWHDIWNYICADNWTEMALLKRRFTRRCDWQACWCEEETRAQR